MDFNQSFTYHLLMWCLYLHYLVQQIHSLVMSLQLSGIEIKSTHSLDSWAGGVLVMVSGSVLTKDYNARRKFVQTFFLAPQEKGYFVLNDIFEFIHDEQILQHPTTLAHDHFVANLDAAKPIAEPGTIRCEIYQVLVD